MPSPSSLDLVPEVKVVTEEKEPRAEKAERGEMAPDAPAPDGLVAQAVRGGQGDEEAKVAME